MKKQKAKRIRLVVTCVATERGTNTSTRGWMLAKIAGGNSANDQDISIHGTDGSASLYFEKKEDFRMFKPCREYEVTIRPANKKKKEKGDDG